MLIAKGLKFFKKNGIASTIKKTGRKICRLLIFVPIRVQERIVAKKHIKELQALAKGKDLHVIIPCIDWHIPLFQRPHQIAWNLSCRKDFFVLFLPDQYQYDKFCFSKKIKDNLFLYSLSAVKYLDQILRVGRTTTTFMTWTRHASQLNKFSYNKLIYDYVDEMTLFYYYNQQMEDTHNYLMKKADLTVVTANALYKSAKPHAKKLLLCENAVDYDFFSKGKECDINSQLFAHIDTNNYDVVLGYYGCLAYWFDYDLILQVAEQKPQWLIVLIGHIFDETSSKFIAMKPDNVLVFPAQPYHELPSFLNAFDIALVPFLISDVTLATSPIKIFEYMAGGKPVLSSNLPECKKYNSIFRYEDKEDFIKKVALIMKHKDSKEYTNLLETQARENTWEARVNNILAGVGIE